MKTKVAAPSDDPDRGRRFAIAIPSAIVITVAFVVLARFQPAEPTALERAPAMTIVLERRAPAPPTPRPTPKPTRPPTPSPTLPPVPRATTAHVLQRIGKPVAHHPFGGTHAASRAVAHVGPAPAVAALAGSGSSGTSVAAGTGAGSGSGNGSGAGDAGTGAATDVNAGAPCGFVDLIPFEAPDHSGTLTYEHIRATVAFPDGHTEIDDFPYRWAYRDPADDPWSPRNMADKNFIVRVQLPPDGADVSRFPETIRYILDHTRRDSGTTTLQDCPGQR